MTQIHLLDINDIIEFEYPIDSGEAIRAEVTELHDDVMCATVYDGTETYHIDDKFNIRVVVPAKEAKRDDGLDAIDVINQPSHYTYGDIEVIDFVEQVTAAYPVKIAFSIGNVIKYVARAPFKNGVEDLKKARFYLNRAIDKWSEANND
jgi:hypothetical protein